MKIETQCLHAGYTPGNGDPRVVPIVQSTTYTFDSTAHIAAHAAKATIIFFMFMLSPLRIQAVTFRRPRGSAEASHRARCRTLSRSSGRSR